MYVNIVVGQRNLECAKRISIGQIYSDIELYAGFDKPRIAILSISLVYVHM